MNNDTKPGRIDWKKTAEMHIDEAESLRQQLADMTAAYTKVTERVHMVGGYLDQIKDSQKQVTLLRQLVPKRIPNGFVSFGKYYSEQEDKFNDPYNSMCKFKRKYLSDCEEALDATEPK